MNYIDRPKSSKYAFIKMMLMSKYSDIHVVAESVLDIWKLILKIYDNENTSLLDTFLPYLIDLYNISLTSHAVVTLLRNYSELDKLVTPIPMNKKSYAMLYVIITQHKQCNHFIQTLQKYQQNDQHRTDLFLLFIKEYLQIFISMNWCFSSKVLEELIQLISVLLQQDLQPSLLLSCFEIIHIVFTYPQYVVMNENVLKNSVELLHTIQHNNIISSVCSTMISFLERYPAKTLYFFQRYQQMNNESFLKDSFKLLKTTDRHLYINVLNFQTNVCIVYLRYLSFEEYLECVSSSTEEFFELFKPKNPLSTTILDCLYSNAIKLMKSFESCGEIPKQLTNVFNGLPTNSPWPLKVAYLKALQSYPTILLTKEKLSYFIEQSNIYLTDVDQRVIQQASKTFAQLFTHLTNKSKQRLLSKHFEHLLCRPDFYSRGTICFLKEFLSLQHDLITDSLRNRLFGIIMSALEHSNWRYDVDVLCDLYDLLSLLPSGVIPQKLFLQQTSAYVTIFTTHLVLLSIYSTILFPSIVNSLLQNVTSGYKYPFLHSVAKNKKYGSLLIMIQTQFNIKNPLLSFHPLDSPIDKLLNKVFHSLSLFIHYLPECTSAYSTELLLHCRLLASVHLKGSIECMKQFVLHSHNVMDNPILDDNSSFIRDDIKKVFDYRDYANIPNIQIQKITEQTLHEIIKHSSYVLSRLRNSSVTPDERFSASTYLSLFYKNTLKLVYDTVAPEDNLTSEWREFNQIIQQYQLIIEYHLRKKDGVPTVSTVFPLFSNIFAEEQRTTKIAKRLFTEAVKQEKKYANNIEKMIIGNDTGSYQTIRMYEGYTELLSYEQKTVEQFTQFFEMKQVQLCMVGVSSGVEILERMVTFVQGIIANGCIQQRVKHIYSAIIRVWRLLKREEMIRLKLLKNLQTPFIFDFDGLNAWKIRMYAVKALTRGLALRSLIFNNNINGVNELIQTLAHAITNVSFLLTPTHHDMYKLYYYLLFNQYDQFEPSSELSTQLYYDVPLCQLQCILPPTLPLLFRPYSSFNQTIPFKYHKIISLLPRPYKIQYLTNHIEQLDILLPTFMDEINSFTTETLEQIAYHLSTTSTSYFLFIDTFPDAPQCDFCELFDYLCSLKQSTITNSYIELRKIQTIDNTTILKVSNFIKQKISYLNLSTDFVENENEHEIIKKGMGILSKMTNKTIHELLMNDFWDYCEVNSINSALRVAISLLSQLGYNVKKITTLDHAIEDYTSPTI
ncbi:Dopey N-terminal domain-containing protein [Entamoeba marina]